MPASRRHGRGAPCPCPACHLGDDGAALPCQAGHAGTGQVIPPGDKAAGHRRATAHCRLSAARPGSRSPSRFQGRAPRSPIIRCESVAAKGPAGAAVVGRLRLPATQCEPGPCCLEARAGDRSIICGCVRSGIGVASSTDQPILVPAGEGLVGLGESGRSELEAPRFSKRLGAAVLRRARTVA